MNLKIDRPMLSREERLLQENKELKALFLAMLLSIPSRSIKVIKVNLMADLSDYEVHRNEDLPSGDIIFSVKERI